MSDKNKKKIFIALLAGAVVSCVSLGMFAKMQKQIVAQNEVINMMARQTESGADARSYVVAQRDMNAGETVTNTDVETSVFSEKQEDALETTEMAVGSVLLEPVKKGQVLTGYVFTGIESSSNPTGLRKGYRALTISTEKMDGLSESIKDGSYVDIFSKNNKNPYMLQNVRILSLSPSDITQKKVASILKAKTVTFEIPSGELKNLVKAYSSNSLLLVSRAPGDASAPIQKVEKDNYSYSSVSYEKPVMPKLPDIKDIDMLPSAATFRGATQSVEVIEANTKTRVDFN